MKDPSHENFNSEFVHFNSGNFSNHNFKNEFVN